MRDVEDVYLQVPVQVQPKSSTTQVSFPDHWLLVKKFDLDYIRYCKRISYFKREKKKERGAVTIHHGKCKFPTPIAYQTQTRLKQTDFNLI